MEYLKYRSAMWWILFVLQMIGAAAFIFFFAILIALFG